MNPYAPNPAAGSLARSDANDMWYDLLRKYQARQVSGWSQQGGWAEGQRDPDFAAGLAMHNSIWGEEKKQDDGMQGMLMQLLSSYGGGG